VAGNKVILFGFYLVKILKRVVELDKVFFSVFNFYALLINPISLTSPLIKNSPLKSLPLSKGVLAKENTSTSFIRQLLFLVIP
jgi:hypothetical protein